MSYFVSAQVVRHSIAADIKLSVLCDEDHMHGEKRPCTQYGGCYFTLSRFFRNL